MPPFMDRVADRLIWSLINEAGHQVKSRIQGRSSEQDTVAQLLGSLANSVGQELHIDIPHVPQGNNYWTVPMQRILNKDTVLQREAVSNGSSCIYRVPSPLADKNRKCFDPYVVSIGPYHHGRCKEYDLLQEDKARCFNSLVNRSSYRFYEYFDAVKKRLDDIKSRYSESIGYYEDNDLVVMIVTDGCFIIEMLRMVTGLVKDGRNDPILNMAGLLPLILRDFMLLENQIPFFVLEDLFDMSKTEGDGYALPELAVNFFNYGMPGPLQFQQLDKEFDTEGLKHLLHLLQLSVTKYAPIEQHQPLKAWEDNAHLPRIPGATKLPLGGISIKRRSDNLINIGFNHKKGLLEIPTLILDDFVSTFLSNCVAFENCEDNSTKRFSTYVTFMRCLINKEVDAEFLSNQRVLENYIGTDADAMNFFNNLAGGSAVDIRRSYMADVFYGVNKYYENKWHKTWAELCNTYFSSPWSFLSAAAVFIALVLTAIQAVCAIIKN